MCKAGLLREQLRHGWIQFHQCDFLDARVLQDFAYGHTITAAQNRYFQWSGPPARGAIRATGKSRHGGMDQCFVVAVFVLFSKLKIAVEKQPVPALAACHHDALVGRVRRRNHRVLVEPVFCPGGDMVCCSKSHADEQECAQAGDNMGGQVP